MLPSPDRNPEALIGILRGRNTFFNDSIVMYQNVRIPCPSFMFRAGNLISIFRCSNPASSIPSTPSNAP